MQESSELVKPYGLHNVFSVSIIMLHVAIGFGNENVYENKNTVFVNLACRHNMSI